MLQFFEIKPCYIKPFFLFKQFPINTGVSTIKTITVMFQNMLTIFLLRETLIAVWLTSLTVTCIQHKTGSQQKKHCFF